MMLPVSLLFVVFHAISALPRASARPKSKPPQRKAIVRGGRGSISNGLNSTAVDLFERSKQSYERTYAKFGRIPSDEVDPNALTLDFEIETCAHVQLTPELLLERGGVDLELAKKSATLQTAWPKVSSWFTAGIDGTGRFVDQRKGKHMSLVSRAIGTYRQDLSGQVELESSLMRPKDVLESSFTSDLQSFMEKTNEAKILHMKTSNDWYELPFKGSKGINIQNSMEPNRPCTNCHVQWTAGLPLRHVSMLLRMGNEKLLNDILVRADDLCHNRQTLENWHSGCTPEYHALISLAAWVASAVQLGSTGCGHPKRYMQPWLVRTHFGDLVNMLKEKGHKLDTLSDDVLQIAKMNSSTHLLPNGAVDYLRLPEMAEMSGMVFPRNPFLRQSHKDTEEDMPTDFKGLLKLSAKMMRFGRLVETRLRGRKCALHSRTNIHADAFTMKDWLDGMQEGKDLMSDHDSPLSKSAFSGMIWKSMGSWRMKPGSDRVYLECRATGSCLTSTKAAPGPAALIHDVGLRMKAFEKFMQMPPSKAQTLKINRDAASAMNKGKAWRLHSHKKKRENLFRQKAKELHMNQAQVLSNGQQVHSKKTLRNDMVRKETRDPD